VKNDVETRMKTPSDQQEAPLPQRTQRVRRA